MEKISFVLLSFIVSSILILTNCSSGSSSKDNNGTSEKEEIENVEESEIIVTDEFLKFLDELWNDEDYNPAKFSVEQEKFKGKWAVLTGEIEYIHSEGSLNSVKMIIKYHEEDYLEREINAFFYFDSPEKIMDFRKGQKIKLKGEYIEGEKQFGVNVNSLFSNYTFTFENPQVIE